MTQSFRQIAHRAALKTALQVERLVDRVKPRGSGVPVLDPYRGFATPDVLVLRGRVLTGLRRTEPSPEASRWQNLRQMASLFLTDEVRHVAVEAAGVRGTSDDEGYLWLEVPRGDAPAGWHEVEVRLPDHDVSAHFPVRVPEAGARLGVISDIDDTMMETGAYSILRNLWTTFTGSALTRTVFPDAVVLMDHLSGHGRNPVYYVSSSPWNLHAFLTRVFSRAGLQPGPMFLRDFGLSEGGFLTPGGHGDHKGAAIDRVMAANPGLPFVLIGDTGQKDAHVYLDACRRHGGWIVTVILREHGAGPDDASRHAISEMRRQGVCVVQGTDFTAVPDRLAAAGVAV